MKKYLGLVVAVMCLSAPAFAGSAKGTGENKKESGDRNPKASEKKQKVCESQCLEYDKDGKCIKDEMRCR